MDTASIVSSHDIRWSLNFTQQLFYCFKGANAASLQQLTCAAGWIFY